MTYAYVGIALETTLALILFRRGKKDFPLFFVYMLARALASITITVGAYIITNRVAYAQMYWFLDVLLHGLLVALLVHLIREALLDPHPLVVVAGAAGILFFVLFSFVLPYDPKFSRWMTGLTRNVSFCEELLNLALWALLVRNRNVGWKFLLISAGLGIQVTGEVTGHSLRLFTHSQAFVWAPNLLINASAFLALGIWLYAFLRPSESEGEGYTGVMNYAAR